MRGRRKTGLKAHKRSDAGSHRAAVAALRAADAAWLRAYRARNAEQAASFYDKRGAMLAPNAPILTGKGALANFIAKSFALRNYQISWRPKQVDVARSGELGYTSGVYRMSFCDPSGRTFSDKGKYLMVWKKQSDGSWKVLFDMSSSDLPIKRD
jgi:ketosteroid isomerase-like protein